MSPPGFELRGGLEGRLSLRPRGIARYAGATPGRHREHRLGQRYAGARGRTTYSAAKAGLINFTQNLAVRYGADGIRANVIAPGTVRMLIWQHQIERTPDVFERLTPWYPLGRVGEPEDIARAALFLASENQAPGSPGSSCRSTAASPPASTAWVKF